MRSCNFEGFLINFDRPYLVPNYVHTFFLLVAIRKIAKHILETLKSRLLNTVQVYYISVASAIPE